MSYNNGTPDRRGCVLGASVRPAFTRVLAVLLAASMAFSSVPCAALAEAADGAAAVGESEQQLSANDVVSSQGLEGEGSDGEVAGENSGQDAEAEASEEPDSQEPSASANEESPSGQEAAPNEPNEASSQNADTASVEASLASADGELSLQSLNSSSSYCVIQDEKDKDSYSSRVTGSISSGTTLWANMYDYYSDEVIPAESDWTYQWMSAPTKASSASDYTAIDGQTSQSLTITDELAEQLAGCYIIVKVSQGGTDYYAPSSYSPSYSSYYTPGPVLAPGSVELYSVELASTDSLYVGATLTATAYQGSYSSKTPVTEGVTYTWQYTTGSASYSSSWTNIEGVTGNTFTLTDEYVGKSIRVTANAGANTVSLSNYSAIGPVKQAGAVEIYAVSFVNATDSTKSTYQVGESIKAQAKERGASSYIDSSKLNYQWQVGDSAKGTFTDIEGATSETLELAADLAGKYVNCTVSSKVGTSSANRSRGQLVASADAVNVTKVTLSYDASALEPGDTITAAATDASGNDVSASENVAWTWYLSEKSGSYSYSDTKIEGASGNTLTIPDDSSYVGKYIQVRANGGFGEVTSRTSAVITLPGAVELYSVTASGTAKTGQTLSASAKKLMSTQGTTSTYTQDVSSSDTVSWQWQYATSSSTSDSAFTDIAGATSSTYTIPETYPDGTSALGTYLRVKATSTNTKASTERIGSYGSSRSPLGPVTQAGVYTLSSVTLSATDANNAEVNTGTGFNVGNTVTPQAMVAKGSYSEEEAPADAKLSYTWYASDSATAEGEVLASGYDGSTGILKLSDDLVGKYLHVCVTSGDNTKTSPAYLVMGAGEYELLRVTLTPGSGDVCTGDTVSASVQARTTTSTTYGDTLSGFDDVTWWVADSADAATEEWTQLEGVSGASITVPQAAAGKYLKVMAKSGSSVVEKAFSSQVIDANSLVAVAKKLSGTKLSPEDVEGSNVNDLLEEKISELGYEGIAVSVRSAEARNANSAAAGSIDVTDTAANGDVEPFFVDLDSSYYSWNTNRQFDCVFTLTRGDETADTSELLVTLPWDASKVEDALEEYAESLVIGYASGDSADAVTQDMTLPYKLADSNGSTKYWSNVSWASSADAVSITGYSWGNKTGEVTRGSADAAVALTATIDAGNRESSGGPSSDISITKTFNITVKADPEKVAAEKAELEAKVDAAFTAESIRYFGSGESVDVAAVTGDLQLPTTRTLGVDGKYYEVSYAASDEAVAVNGYHAIVTRPLAPDASKTLALTLTVTSKENPEVTASKSLDVTIAPIADEEIDAAVELMEAAKADFSGALLGSNASAAAVESDLDSFYEVTAAEDGTLLYARTSAESTGTGIYLAELPGYDAMSGTSWRTLRSSDESVISSENLLVTRPEADAIVMVTGNLSYAAFESLAAAHPENAKLQGLVNQQVTATYRVVGTTTHEDPQISVGFELVGTDSFGEEQVWYDGATSVAYGSTAGDLIEQVLDAQGLSREAYGVGESSYYLNSITSADGRVLGWDASTGKYWQLFVNGEAASVGAGQITLSPGDEVVLYYSAWGASVDDIGQAKVTATVKVIGAAADGDDQTWVSATEVSLASGSTAADATERVLAGAGLSYEVQNTWGWFLNSITSSDGRALATKPDYSAYWQFFVNGEMASVGAGSYELKPGDVVTWYYGGYDAELPENDVEVDADAKGPDWEAEWPGYANGTTGGIVVEDASTATEGGSLAWAKGDLGTNMLANIYASDPIIVNGSLYLAVGDQLQVRDAATGEVTATATLATTVDSVARMVYVNTPATGGLIIVPLHGGRAQALVADALTTRWLTDELGEKQQSLSALTVADGYVYLGTSNNAGLGYLTCVNIATGAVRATAESAGYYWGGAALVGSRLVIASNDGTVRSLDASTLGDGRALTLGAEVYSQVVSDGSYLYVVSRDGVLHKLALAGDGSLSELGSVSFAGYSTSTPAIVDGRAYVGGADGTSGVLAVIDLASMTVEHKATSFSNGVALAGEVKSSPTVSVQEGGTYVYFTCNAKENGGAFLYKLGDAYASVLYLTTGDQAEYTMSSLVADGDGALYFINDAGYLFRVEPGGRAADPEKKDDSGDDSGADNKGNGSGGEDDSSADGSGDGSVNGSTTKTKSSGNGSISLKSNTTGSSKNGTGTSGSNKDEQGGSDSASGTADEGASGGGVQTTGTSAAGATDTGASADAETGAHGLPIWPFIGMAIGAAGLAWALWVIIKRRGDDDEQA